MVFTYRELEEKGYTDYKIKKMLANEELYMIKKGMYTDNLNYNYLEYIYKKHPNAVITLQSAAYCYGLIKEEKIPYVVATKQKDRKIKNEKIKQIFVTDSLYKVGIQTITYKGFKIQIYDLERLLIDIVRNKVNIPYEEYKEIINNYHKLSKLLNKNKLNEYIVYFKDEKIIDRIKKEVL